MIFLLFCLGLVYPKRTRPPPTPTRSVNRKPTIISGYVILPCIIIASIIASILFFVINKKKSKVQFIENQELPSIKHTPKTARTARTEPKSEVTPLLENNEKEEYSYEYYEEEEDYYYSDYTNSKRALDSSSDEQISLAKINIDDD